MKFPRLMRHVSLFSLWLAGFVSFAVLANAHNSHEEAGPISHIEPDSVPPRAPSQAAAFQLFEPQVQLRWDASFLYVGSNGLPAHGMMVGITAWQQQVPLPQGYFGTNAWRIPLYPVPADAPQMIKGRFLRGAIAVAANGIPIFNPQNNRGEISQEIGELDQWGGHCGRADDYHYHAAPLHLQSVVGKTLPIAYALDGYAIYGLADPDGSKPGNLDPCRGHTNAALGYHYHASTHYPYINGGFHGQVVERDGQVDPQPRAQPVRPSLPPLDGAVITAFTASPDANSFALKYAVNGQTAEVNYSTNGSGGWNFQFVDAKGSKREETYTARDKSSGNPAPKGRSEAAMKGASNLVTTRNSRPASASVAPAPENPKPVDCTFSLTSPEVSNGGLLPRDYTGDGSGSTLPLAWSGAPAGTQAYALIMHHIDPEGVAKWYWTLYDIPAEVNNLPKNVSGIGKVGTGFRGKVGYEPPHSQGPGSKTYTLTLYALSSPIRLTCPPAEVNRAVLLEAIKGKVIASSELNVTYTRSGAVTQSERPQSTDRAAPPARPKAGDRPRVAGPAKDGMVKPATTDTAKVNVYADNWFILYINGKLTAVDPVEFLPHNVVSIDILPEYPMTIAVMAKDNADPKTGLEYGQHIGDAGFIIKFADGTVSNATWKVKCYSKGPLNRDTEHPLVAVSDIPADWFSAGFDDSAWSLATEYPDERIRPDGNFNADDFAGAKFIWSDDLDLDNTVIFRTRVDKRGWKPRWNAQPNLDVSGAPLR